MTEYKATVTEGFRTEPFEAEVTDLVVKEVSGYNKVIFEFAEGPNLSIFPPKEIVDGVVPGYMDLGILINSLTSLGIETFISVDDDTLTLDGLRTEPNICGKTLTFDVNKRNWFNDEGEEKTNYDWRVTKAEGSSTPPTAGAQHPTPTPPSKPAESTQPASDDSEAMELWNMWAMEVLGDEEPHSPKEIMDFMAKNITDRKKRTQYNRARTKALDKMVGDGEITFTNGKYQIVIV